MKRRATSPCAPRSRSQRGASMIELTCSVAVLVVGVLGTVSTFARCRDLDRTTEREDRLRAAVQAQLERWRTADVDTAVAEARKEADAGDRQDAHDGTTTSADFPAELLERTLDPGALEQLRYRDLDGDGVLELDVASATTRTLLPVRVTGAIESGRLALSTLVMR